MEANPVSQLDPGAVYEAAMARRTQQQQKVEGQAALRLIESAAAVSEAPQQRALPPNATISIRV